MSTPGNEPPAEQVATPTVSTAPTSGTAGPPQTSWWHWRRLPDHLGRARTSTVILSVLFVAIFTLYLNVRPDPPADPARTSPAGGGSDVDAPLNPVLPTEPTTTTPEPTEEPAPTTEPTPTTEPEETTTPGEDTGTPSTGSTTTSPDTGTTEPTTGPSTPTETTEPTSPTDGTTEPSTSSPSPTG